MKRPEVRLRFRTKKDFIEAKKAAKILQLSLNEYVIRVVQWAIGYCPPITDTRFDRAISDIQTPVDN